MPLIAAALGRCDPGNVFLNGLGIYIASLFYASRGDRTWRWSRLAFVLVLMLVSWIQRPWINGPTFARLGIGVVVNVDGGQLRQEVSKMERTDYKICSFRKEAEMGRGTQNLARWRSTAKRRSVCHLSELERQVRCTLRI